MIYSVFLRGINTGKLKLLNDDFSQMLTRSGCLNSKTIQAAGTAVFSCKDADMEAVRTALENELLQFFGKRISFILRSREQINQIMSDLMPIRSAIDFHDYVMLTDDSSLFAEIEQAHMPIQYSSGERLMNQQGYFLWTIEKGSTLNEFGSKVLGSKNFKDRLTSRNFNTIVKVAEAMAKIIE
jgi:uncharacterized protein (DUF1697 family)